MTAEQAPFTIMAGSASPTNLGRVPATNAVAGAAGGVVSVLLGEYHIASETAQLTSGKCRPAVR